MNTSAGISLYAIHGFLGSPLDWQGVFSPRAGLEVYTPSLSRSPPLTLSALAERVNLEAASSGAGRKVLLGYSLGGRVALHSLLQSPPLWSAAVIVSAHPGLASAQEKSKRLENDQQWAKRFREEEGSAVMAAWNAQSVFKQDRAEAPVLAREAPSVLDRHKWADLLLGCSLGVQADLSEALSRLQIPVLWISGELDLKFKAIHGEIGERNPKWFQHEVLPQAGHRVPWDQTRAFEERVIRFLGISPK